VKSYDRNQANLYVLVLSSKDIVNNHWIS